MSKAEEKTTELMKKAKDFIPNGGYSEKELNLAFFMFIKGYQQAEKDLTDEARLSSGRDGFIYAQGYKQSEKDLLENKHEKSWRLDKKLWSGIKDVEEASYQYVYDASNDWAYDVPIWNDVQEAFKAGSEWKENLELTWQDMEKIVDLYEDVYCDFSIDGKGGHTNTKEHYQEVLKRFKAKKNE